MDNSLDNQHGGNITAFAKKIGCEPSEVIDLSSNINFVKPNINLNFNTLDISAYPNYEKLEASIANLYDVETKEMELFNGATTAIYALLRNLKLKEVNLYAPLYLEYEKASKLYGYKLKHINRFNNIYEEVQENTLVVFVNPSTPDGKFYELKKLMKIWRQKNCTILIDESFLDFSHFSSISSYLKSYNKLYILKSMTKFYAAAGIRIGALLSNSQNIQQLKKQEPLWKISQFDSHYLQDAIADETFKTRSARENAISKHRLMQVLINSPYINKIYPSNSNFILIELKNINAEYLQQQLIPFKIMIRNCHNFSFLAKQHVRIAVKDIKSIESLNIALQKIVLLT